MEVSSQEGAKGSHKHNNWGSNNDKNKNKKPKGRICLLTFIFRTWSSVVVHNRFFFSLSILRRYIEHHLATEDYGRGPTSSPGSDPGDKVGTQPFSEMDHYTFLGNCPPTHPLSQHFASSEK